MISGANHTFAAQTLTAYLPAVPRLPSPLALHSLPSFLPSQPAALASRSQSLLSPPPLSTGTPGTPQGSSLHLQEPRKL